MASGVAGKQDRPFRSERAALRGLLGVNGPDVVECVRVGAGVVQGDVTVGVGVGRAGADDDGTRPAPLWLGKVLCYQRRYIPM